jgi:acetylornithine deacetylase
MLARMRPDPDRLVADLAALVQVPSVTGDERAVLERLGELAAAHGLAAELVEHDLAALRAHPGHPGEEVPRTALPGLTVTLPGRVPGRICLNGHIDVVAPGGEAWEHGPWSGVVRDGHLHGRGAVDMKGGVAAALHALVALKAVEAPTVVLQAVAGEEDGGIGTFAALEADAAFDAALIPEPTGLAVVCAQAGALTFRGVVRGRAAHAALRLEGESAIDRYLPVHAALAEHERTLNADVAHPLMRALPLPYPVSVGRVEAGVWSSTVPDRLVFEGRLGVRVGEAVADARAGLEAALPGVALEWVGGAFAPGETRADHPWVTRVAAAVEAERGAPAVLTGVSYGADMRQFTARGIPCVMLGPGGLERAHAVDERVPLADLAALARILARALRGPG